MILHSLFLIVSLATQRDSSGPRLLDGFEQLGGWSAHPADGVKATLYTDRGHTGLGMRMDFDFQGGGGYAIARRSLSLTLPGNYAISFWLRGPSPVNTLEFKLADSTGENVWWYTERDRSFPAGWQRVTIRRRQIAFAWGPLGGGELKQAASIELVITAGRGGGKGSVWFDDLVLTPLPDLGTYDQVPVATATAAAASFREENAVDGDSNTVWRTPPIPKAELTIDFQRAREFGGLTLRWQPGSGARDYNIQLSDDGKAWEMARRVRGSNGGRDDIRMADRESRYVRLQLLRPEGKSGYGLAEVVVQPLSYGASLNAFWEAIAASEPAGTYPRYLSGRRAYWTVVGLDSAKEEALFNEDGALEAGKGDFSVEPFIGEDQKLYSWNDASTKPSLAEGDLPIPSVTWNVAGLQLTITAFAIGPTSSSSVVARYRVKNLADSVRTPTIYLAVRPFQVNPPWQFLNTIGGAARIESLQWTGTALRVNDHRVVIPFTRPSRIGVTTFDGGEVVSHLRGGRVPAAQKVDDPFGAASGVLAWPMRLPPGETAEVAIEIPLTDLRPNLAPASLDLLAQAESEVIGAWQETLNRASISLPSSADHLTRTIKSTLGYIMINRDGPAIQPGSRSYERSWIRDGSLTSAALLRFGHPEMVKQFIEWYARYQYPDGKVPCCVDRRGADPVPEHDSHGEFIYLVMEYWRHTGDTTLLASMWPKVELAANYIDMLRQTRRTADYQEPDKKVFYGLLPPSISHEGYSAKPMHSYWDDFFALRGLKDAATMAEILNHPAVAQRIAAIRDEFKSDLLVSIDRVMQEKKIDFLPGSADLGDFDATSTTIALTPVGEQQSLPDSALRRTFERYWQNILARRAQGSSWDAYTPYELRAVGSLLRIFGKTRALELMNQFLEDQEPVEWNQWPEVVWQDRHAPKFIGDSPHTWVGSDFLRSAADLFVYENEADSSLVLASGVDENWLAAPGVAVKNLSTWWGPLSYSLKRDGNRVIGRIEGGVRVPAGGIRFAAPSPDSLKRATIDGTVSPVAHGNLTIRRLPADIVFEY